MPSVAYVRNVHKPHTADFGSQDLLRCLRQLHIGSLPITQIVLATYLQVAPGQ